MTDSLNDDIDDFDFEIDLPSDIDDQLTNVLRQDFVDDCTDKLEAIGKELEKLYQNREKDSSVIKKIRGLAHSIKGVSTTFGYAAIGIVSHRMEDYLDNEDSLTRQEISEIYVFIDVIKILLEHEIPPENEEIAKIIRTLPMRLIAEDIVRDHGHVEVLLIMQKNMQQRLISNEITACGFHIMTVDTVFQAIEMAARTKPDLILASAVLDQLDGGQLAHIFQAMKATKDIPFVLITSFSDKEKQKQELPKNALIARKGEDFPTDFSECTIDLGLFDKKD